MFKAKCVIAGRPCPENNDPTGGDYCPAWVNDLVETNLKTGEERVLQDCIHRHQGRLMAYVIQASNRPAEEIGRMSGELQSVLARSLVEVAQAITRAPALQDRAERPEIRDL